ncbi:hypothetical protein [Psychrobacter sp. P11G5]|uniref:hypothetical protein n=1 Tax=Psychrobacter sp. P11G5 TaxID=1699624 RepID=UPI00078BA441|nr:hypothetical protein [Psychrobacter sp. P11G5]AMN67218.1 hypothetical protein AK825_05395 [Psychrobacter sp. P11G5]
MNYSTNLKSTTHLDKRMNVRGISKAMIEFAVKYGELHSDKLMVNRKLLRQMVESINVQAIRLGRLRKKFGEFGVIRLIDKALNKLKEQKKIALKIVAKGGIVVVVANNTLITTYDLDSYRKY